MKFKITPNFSDINLDHYHNLLLNKDNSGQPEYVYIENEAVYYAPNNNPEYFIHHLHTINNNIVENSSSNISGIMSWQNLESSQHNHTIPKVVMGDSKVIYSISEDKFGNIYMGTSNGFMMYPYYNLFEFVINGHIFYEQAITLNEAIVKAQQNYEFHTNTILNLTPKIYNQQLLKLMPRDQSI